MKNEKIDLRGKSEKEILEAYINIAKDTEMLQKIYDEAGNYEEAMEIYKKMKENETNKDNIRIK